MVEPPDVMVVTTAPPAPPEPLEPPEPPARAEVAGRAEPDPEPEPEAAAAATKRSQSVDSATLLRCPLTTAAVGQTVLNDGVPVGIGRAGFVGAVTDTKAEISIGAEAGGIGTVATQSAGLTKHVTDAGLLSTLATRSTGQWLKDVHRREGAS